MQMKQRRRFSQQQWLGITTTASYAAVGVHAQQHRLAIASMPSRFMLSHRSCHPAAAALYSSILSRAPTRYLRRYKQAKHFAKKTSTLEGG